MIRLQIIYEDYYRISYREGLATMKSNLKRGLKKVKCVLEVRLEASKSEDN